MKVFKSNQRHSRGCNTASPFPVSSLVLKSVIFHMQRANKYMKIIRRWKFREVWRRKDLMTEGFVKRITGWDCLTELHVITDASQP